MKYYLPENLTLEKILTDHPPSFNYKLPYLKYLLTLIGLIPANYKHIDLIKGYTPISSRALKGKIKTYSKYYEYAEQMEIIIIDPSYYEGKKCKGYKFTEKYQTRLVSEEVKDYRVKKYMKNETEFNRNMLRKHKHLHKWLNSDLEIDAISACDYAQLVYNEKINGKRLIDTNSKGKMINPKDQFKWAQINIQNIKDHVFFPFVDPVGFRFHSTLTSLKSELRNFLTYQEKNLVALDLKNSQPFLSTIILNPEFWNKNSTTVNIYNISSPKTRKYLLNTINTRRSFIWAKFNTLEYQQGFEHYKKIVESGFYEYMQAELSRELGQGYNSRDNVKRTMFQVLFSKNSSFYQKFAAPKRVFARLFPEVYEFFCFIKSIEYEQLACLLQNIESHIFLNVITKQISKEKPRLPLFTIHDSIVTTIGNENYVKNIMKKELRRLVRAKPTIKREYWLPENLIEIPN
jgi:hypothetical protein